MRSSSEAVNTFSAEIDFCHFFYGKVYRDGDVFVLEDERLFDERMFQDPRDIGKVEKGFWKKVRQLYFDLIDGKDDKVCAFLQQYGIPEFLHEASKGIFDEGVGRGVQLESRPFIPLGLRYDSLKKVLEWFVELLALFENLLNGRTEYLKERLGWGFESKEPWSQRIPADSFYPYMITCRPLYDPKRGVYALPRNEEAVKREVLRLVLDTVRIWLNGLIRWEISSLGLTKRGISHTWCFAPTGWMGAAIVSWYLEEVATLKPCACGCGLPAKPGGKYHSKSCGDRDRKRRERAKAKGLDLEYCVLCGREIEDGEMGERIAKLRKGEISKLMIPPLEREKIEQQTCIFGDEICYIRKAFNKIATNRKIDLKKILGG